MNDDPSFHRHRRRRDIEINEYGGGRICIKINKCEICNIMELNGVAGNVKNAHSIHIMIAIRINNGYENNFRWCSGSPPS